MQSNGYVSWAPRRMELYPLPGQDNLPMWPAEQLAVHEAAHVLQLSSLNRTGLARALWYLLGEQSVGSQRPGDTIMGIRGRCSLCRNRHNTLRQGTQQCLHTEGQGTGNRNKGNLRL
ncbi:MAG: hypothetical protein MZV63_31595 [Marinilabiliales bacterium]|nr:hypothetical protein [Marinilabiliales bacterium]